MSREDEELQRRIEAGQQPEGVDGQAYVKVFSALKREPEMRISPAFADKVVQRALALSQAKDSKRDMWWLGLGIFFLTLAFIIAFAFVGFRMNLGFLRILGDFKWLLLCGGVLIWIFNMIDKKLVKPTNLQI